MHLAGSRLVPPGCRPGRQRPMGRGTRKPGDGRRGRPGQEQEQGGWTKGGRAFKPPSLPSPLHKPLLSVSSPSACDVLAKQPFTLSTLQGPPLRHKLVLEGLVTFSPGPLRKWEGEGFRSLCSSPCVLSKSKVTASLERDPPHLLNVKDSFDFREICQSRWASRPTHQP